MGALELDFVDGLTNAQDDLLEGVIAVLPVRDRFFATWKDLQFSDWRVPPLTGT